MSRIAGVPLVVVVVCALVQAAGCGETGSTNDAAAGGSGGRGGGSGGSGGAGGSAETACPTAPPAPGALCAGTPSCFYEDCAGSGRTVARCVNGAFSIETGSCTGVFCQSQTCAVGQLCSIRAGGALLAECVANSCGAAAITCGCLQSCIGVCTVGGSLESGVTIQCNTCPTNLCP